MSSTFQSADNTTLFFSLSFSVPSSSAAAHEAVDAIRTFAAQNLNGPEIYVTGSAGVSTDALNSIHQTINKATLVTVLLVVVLLLLIYRSPIAMLVPLVTIGVAYLISRGLTGFIAQAGFSVSTLVDAYLVVTLFGIGTDYCLFMVSRFKEEILRNERAQASAQTLHHIGPVIVASATTVIVALMCLGISRFGMNRTSGMILAMGVAITLLAGLTLTPALIAVFGRRLLWPAHLQTSASKRPGLWYKVGQQIVRRPLFLVIPIIVVLAIPYLTLHRLNYSASMIGEMPDNMNSVRGYQLWTDHFPAGRLNPVDLVVESQTVAMTDPVNLKTLGLLNDALVKLNGVSGVNYYAAPAPDLHKASLQVAALATELGPATINQLGLFQTLQQTLQTTVVQYPGVMQSANFQSAAGALDKIGSSAAALQANPAQGLTGLAALKPLLTGLADSLEKLSAEFNLQAAGPFVDWLKVALFFHRRKDSQNWDLYCGRPLFNSGNCHDRAHPPEREANFVSGCQSADLLCWRNGGQSSRYFEGQRSRFLAGIRPGRPGHPVGYYYIIAQPGRPSLYDCHCSSKFRSYSGNCRLAFLRPAASRLHDLYAADFRFCDAGGSGSRLQHFSGDPYPGGMPWQAFERSDS